MAPITPVVPNHPTPLPPDDARLIDSGPEASVSFVTYDPGQSSPPSVVAAGSPRAAEDAGGGEGVVTPVPPAHDQRTFRTRDSVSCFINLRNLAQRPVDAVEGVLVAQAFAVPQVPEGFMRGRLKGRVSARLCRAHASATPPHSVAIVPSVGAGVCGGAVARDRSATLMCMLPRCVVAPPHQFWRQIQPSRPLSESLAQLSIVMRGLGVALGEGQHGPWSRAAALARVLAVWLVVVAMGTIRPEGPRQQAVLFPLS